ncbi:hypothetical protein V5799_000455 [Amblyomma americanum]|uniref:HD domain-containing protein n=1 Tax=Amblyomma americanum TaxID=6943 RepID=A0AAQ4D303_AMBAM
MASSALNALSYFMFIGKLKGIRRTGWVLRGVPDPERISGHMYRMSVMAMMLGNDPDAGVNKDKYASYLYSFSEKHSSKVNDCATSAYRSCFPGALNNRTTSRN